ncbi:hypothetical protein VZT92_005682 [Zoarces viviparus]|uniref:Uncharacterized protein n=1 Tax=Zoarces viviparus TaxID=48416 RepID=A0AAW1FT72_ZOAVI
MLALGLIKAQEASVPAGVTVGWCGGELGHGRAGTDKASEPICHIYGWTVTRLGRPAKRRCAASDYGRVSRSARQTESGHMLTLALVMLMEAKQAGILLRALLKGTSSGN